MTNTKPIKSLIAKHLNAENLKHKVYVGTLVTTLGFGMQKFLQLASNLILTRLLFPEAFGLMALVNVFILGAQMLSDVGIKTAIIQMKYDDQPNFLNTAWTLQLIRGVLIWACLCLLAYPLSVFYEEPMLFGLVCVASTSAIFRGGISINETLAERSIRVHTVLAIRIVSQLLGIILMCVLAYIYKSVWPLAIGTVFSACVNLVAGHVFLSGHVHRLQLDWKVVKRLFNYGRWIFWGTLLTYIGGQGSRAIEGAFVSAETLGFISIASMVAWTFGELIQKILDSVVLPALSKLDRDNTSKFIAALHKMRAAILAATIPVFGLVSVLSGVIIGILYDERYQMAAPLLAILAIGGAIGTLPMLYQNALLAKGDSRSHFVLTAISTALRTAGLIAGFYVFGVIGMMAGAVLGRLFSFLLISAMMFKRGWCDWKADALSIFLIGAFAFASFYIYRDFPLNFS